MTKTFDSTTPYGKLAVLLLSPPGQGKTTLVLQWPDLGYINLDNNLDGPVRYLKSVGRFKPFKHAYPLEDSNGKPLEDCNVWSNLKLVTKELLADSAVGCIVIDSMTVMNRLCTNHVLYLKGHRDPDAVMEMKYWDIWKAAMFNYIMDIRNSGKHLFVLCHIKYVRGEFGDGIKKILPTISSNLADYFGCMFTDIWFSRLQVVSGKPQHTIESMGTAIIDLKSSILLPASETAENVLKKALMK